MVQVPNSLALKTPFRSTNPRIKEWSNCQHYTNLIMYWYCYILCTIGRYKYHSFSTNKAAMLTPYYLGHTRKSGSIWGCHSDTAGLDPPVPSLRFCSAPVPGPPALSQHYILPLDCPWARGLLRITR